MKTIEKSMYQRPELTAFVQEQLKQLDQHIHIDAENHGARNKPPLLELNINSYVNAPTVSSFSWDIRNSFRDSAFRREI